MPTFLELLLSSSLAQLVFFPVAACVPLFLLPSHRPGLVRLYGLGALLGELTLGLRYLGRSWTGSGSFPALAEGPVPWIESYGISWNVGLDGISLPLVALTLLLMPLVLLGSWKGIDQHWKGFVASLLLLTTGMLGALVSMDLFLFFVFWELMLVPMYLIIGIWGGDRRIYAAVKFFLFTMAGSLPMLVALLWMGAMHHDAAGFWSFAYSDLIGIGYPLHAQRILFGALAFAFAIKVPMFPLHTWLPDAHVQAPTGGSVVLAGVLLKLGTYGFLRFALPMFPHAAAESRGLLTALAIVGIVYGALVAWVQTDIKKLVAYSSIAHLGFVMLGILAFDLLAWQGAVLQMVNHGLSTGALFLLVGMLYERRHSKKFEDFGGLAKPMPWFAFFLTFSALASAGLPALNGFVGEFLILVGTYRSDIADLRWAAGVGAFGVILAAVYLLEMLLKTLWGPIRHEENRGLADLSLREIGTLLPLAVLMLWIGLAPRFFLEPSRAALEGVLARIEMRLTVEPEPIPVRLTAGDGEPTPTSRGAR